MTKNKVQIKEIAERLGLSPGTVSIVLNGRGDKMRISKETQKRVKEVAQEMDYQPNIYARRLRKSGSEAASRVIAVLWNSGYDDEIMGSFFRGLQNLVKESGEHVEFYVQMFAYGMLSECERIMTPERFSGIIISGISDADSEFLNSRSFDVPIVCAFRNEKQYHCVYINDYGIGANAASLFAQRGHKTAGLIGSNQKGPNSVLREMGFVDKCVELGMTVKEEWVREEAGRDYHSGYIAMDEVLKCKSRPTAMFVNVPDQAIGATVACRNNGLKFKEDIELLAVGSKKAFEYFSPAISTVGISTELIAKNTLELLFLAGNKENAKTMSRVLDAEYTFGDTCGGFGTN